MKKCLSNNGLGIKNNLKPINVHVFNKQNH